MEGFNDFVFVVAVSYTHLRAHETVLDLVCRLLLEKTCCDFLLLLSFDSKFNNSTSTVEGLNDFVFVVAGKNESTVVGELLNTRSKKELYVGSGIVSVSYTHLTLPTIYSV